MSDPHPDDAERLRTFLRAAEAIVFDAKRRAEDKLMEVDIEMTIGEGYARAYGILQGAIESYLGVGYGEPEDTTTFRCSVCHRNRTVKRTAE